MSDTVNALNPEGQFVSIPADKVGVAETQGFKILSPEESKATWEQIDRTKAVEAEKARIAGVEEGSLSAKILSNIGAASGTMADTLSFGAFTGGLKAFDRFTGSNAADTMQAMKEAHPIAETVGLVGGLGAGFAGSLPGAITGTGAKIESAGNAVSSALGKLPSGGNILESGTKVATQAAKYATEGAMLAAPAATMEVLAGDPDRAAEVIAMGAGFGGALGGGASLVRETLKIGGKFLPAVSSKLLSEEVNQGAKALGFQKGLRNKYGQKRVEELVDFAKKEDLFNRLDKADDIEQFVTELRNSEGKKIGSLIDALDKGGKATVDTDSLLQKLGNIGDELPVGELMRKDRTAYETAVNDILDRLSTYGPSLRTLQNSKMELGEYAFQNLSNVRDGRQYVAKVYGVVNDALGESIEAASGNSGQWKELKTAWKNYNDLLAPIKNRAAQEGNAAIGLSDLLTAGIGATTGGLKGAAIGLMTSLIRKSVGSEMYLKGMSSLRMAADATYAAIEHGVNKFYGNATVKQTQELAKKYVGQSALPSMYAISSHFDEANTTSNEHIASLRANLSSILSDGRTAAETLSRATEGSLDDAGVLAPKVQQQLMKSIEYLDGKIPRQADELNPFEKTKSKLTDRQVAKVDRAFRAVTNPMVMLSDLNARKLDADTVEAVRTVYPQLYQKAVQSAIAGIGERKTALSAKDKQQLSILLNQPISGMGTPDKINLLQGAYAISPQQPRKGGSLGLAEQQETSMTRMMGR